MSVKPKKQHRKKAPKKKAVRADKKRNEKAMGKKIGEFFLDTKPRPLNWGTRDVEPIPDHPPDPRAAAPNPSSRTSSPKRTSR